MKMHVGQIYIDPEAAYPFSHLFQRFITAELSGLQLTSAVFDKKFGPDFHLMFRMSAKQGIATVEVRGPTVFKKDKDVEYTLFLPHPGGYVASPMALSVALHHLIDGIVSVLASLEVETSALKAAAPGWIAHILASPEMCKSG